MKKTAFILGMALLATACIDEPYIPDTPDDSTQTDNGPHALVLCEGSWGSNDASLARISLGNGAIDNEWFEVANGRGLGDVAQDMVVYGSKAYITVTFSNSLEVVDTATGRSERHPMGDSHPRYITADGGRLFVSCYVGHKVMVYDTADLDQPVAELPLGDFQPEGVCTAAGRLFVASSWIQEQNQNYTYDSLVYVFNLATLTLDTTLVAGINPQMAVAFGNSVAVNYNGNYTPGSAGCAIIDANTLAVTQLGRTATGMTAARGTLYGFSREGYSATSTATYWRYDGSSFADINVGVNTPYSISADAAGNLYVTTDGNYVAAGDVLCLAPDGTLRWRSEAGILPKKVLVLGE
ncbi:MAG: hypothetical protein IKR83_04925 [Bacteroidales bacterium]|nr:hypothetical protein [Bacteroidales bacterium]